MALTRPNLQQGWFTSGPTISFRRSSRTGYWLITLILYGMLNIFQLRMQAGVWYQWHNPYASNALSEQLLGPLNIFAFPGQIVVLGLVMALLCVTPIVMAQFYNLMHAIPFVLLVVFLGHNRILALCLFFSCAAVSFELLRFKSKFVAAVLCLLPVMFYWWLFGGVDPSSEGGDVLRWALLYAPWVLAFLNCVVLFGVAITIGHFLRYHPGVLMPLLGLGLAATVLLFNYTVGITERDYQALVYRYAPQRNVSFRAASIVGVLEQELAERLEREPYLPREGTLERLRMEWRWAFQLGPIPATDGVPSRGSGHLSQANYKAMQFLLAKRDSIKEIDRFIELHPNHGRVADALYCKALLIDLNADRRALRDDDMLRYYDDLPRADSESVWRELLERFGDTPMGIEARWRIAWLAATHVPVSSSDSFRFREAGEMLEGAEKLCRAQLEDQGEEETGGQWWSIRQVSVFTPPAPTFAKEDLQGLYLRIGKLADLIGKANRTGHLEHEERLARFVGLDQRQLDFQEQLKMLLFDSPQPDPLIDNIRLAQVRLEKDPDQRIIDLANLIHQYPDSDGGVQGRLELARTLLEQRNRSEHLSDRQSLLAESRKHLQAVIAKRGNENIWGRQAAELLDKNPVE